EIGGLAWAAPQDWMCEPFIVKKTGMSVPTHQRKTCINYLALMECAPDVPWIPVLQGYTRDEYFRHVEMYHRYRVEPEKLPLVGLGSVCRRQAERTTAELIEDLQGVGIKPHGFGLKLQGLSRASRFLRSADSMAWSFDARRLPGAACGSKTHAKCANCLP